MRRAATLALLLALAALPALPGEPARAEHVEVNDRTMPFGACARVCIPAIVNPRFTEEPYLGEEEFVVGVALEGDARAYPIQVLVWHEIVNDAFEGAAVAVTYCPLCFSSLVYERAAGARTLTFQTSGRLYWNDLVMLDDETRSLWPQILSQAVDGPLHGTELKVLPSTVTTWGEWRAAHPATRLLARPLCSDWPYAVNGCPSPSKTFARQYGVDPYGDYGESRFVGIYREHRGDIQGLHPKTIVVGLEVGNASKAWPLPALAEEPVVVDEVGGVPIVVAWDGAGARVFRREAGQRFVPLNATHMRDTNGTAWSVEHGTAEDGRRLEQLASVTSFWFAWFDFHPQTLLHGAARVLAAEPGEGARLGATQGITLRFSHAMDRASVEAGLSLEPEHNVSLAWRDNETLVLSPEEPWEPGRTYELRLLGGVSRAGLPLAPHVQRFRAEGGGLAAGFEDPGIAPGLGVLFAAAVLLALGRRVLRRRT